MDILDYLKFGTARFVKLDRAEINGLVVSTVFATDTRQYETAILDKNTTIPVERYPSESEAKSGHDKWIKWASECKDGDKVMLVGIKDVYSENEKDRLVEVRLGYSER